MERLPRIYSESPETDGNDDEEKPIEKSNSGWVVYGADWMIYGRRLSTLPHIWVYVCGKNSFKEIAAKLEKAQTESRKKKTE